MLSRGSQIELQRDSCNSYVDADASHLNRSMEGIGIHSQHRRGSTSVMSHLGRQSPDPFTSPRNDTWANRNHRSVSQHAYEREQSRHRTPYDSGPLHDLVVHPAYLREPVPGDRFHPVYLFSHRFPRIVLPGLAKHFPKTAAALSGGFSRLSAGCWRSFPCFDWHPGARMTKA